MTTLAPTRRSFLVKMAEYCKQLYKDKGYIVLYGLVAESMCKHYTEEELKGMITGGSNKQISIANKALDAVGREYVITVYNIPALANDCFLNKQELTLVCPFAEDKFRKALDTIVELNSIQWRKSKGL